MRRVVAGAFILPALAACWFSLGILILGVAVMSDPFTPRGDPCCGAGPDSWDDVYGAVPELIGFASVTGLLLSVPVWLFRYAMDGSFPRKRWLLIPPLFLVLASLTTIGLALWPTRDDPRWVQQDSPKAVTFDQSPPASADAGDRN
jgi:hypothetical protein